MPVRDFVTRFFGGGSRYVCMAWSIVGVKVTLRLCHITNLNAEKPIYSTTPKPGSIVIVDSTGLKVYGKDEWHQEKHNVSARRTWRKLHLAIDENHQVLACELTTPDVRGRPHRSPEPAGPNRHALRDFHR